MTTTTLPTRPAAALPTPAARRVTAEVRDVAHQDLPGRALAFVAPLGLFAHGIVAWVVGLGAEGAGAVDAAGGIASPARSTGTVALAAGASLDGDDVARIEALASGLTLVAALAGLAWLVAALGRRLEHLDLGTPATVVASFGVGAAGAVWAGQAAGLLDASLPTALVVGGPVLVGLALAAVLSALAVEGVLPVGSAALAAVAGVVLAVPFGLVPLGALLLLIALAPLTRRVA